MIGLLSFLFSLVCLLTILLILIQKGKSSLGMGNIASNNQMLFGGSGGQDFFQKLTWVFGAILILGSLGLALLRTKAFLSHSKYITQTTPVEATKAVQDMVNQAPSAEQPVEEAK